MQQAPCTCAAPDSALPLQVTGNLVRVRTLVSQHLAKADEEKTTDWLYACTKGDNNKVRQVRAHRISRLACIRKLPGSASRP